VLLALRVSLSAREPLQGDGLSLSLAVALILTDRQMVHYVAWVKPGFEFIVANRLGGFAPKSIRLTKPKRKRKFIKIITPAFGPYVMFPAGVIEMALKDADIHHILSNSEGNPIGMRDGDVDKVRILEADGAFNFTPNQKIETIFKKGDKVTINVGAFNGIDCVVTDDPGNDSHVLVDIGAIKINIKLSFLRKSGDK